MQIRIVGHNDGLRERLERITREVAAELRLNAHIEVSDIDGLPIASAVTAPALVVNGLLRSTGRVPTRNEIGSWLQPHWY